MKCKYIELLRENELTHRDNMTILSALMFLSDLVKKDGDIRRVYKERYGTICYEKLLELCPED